LAATEDWSDDEIAILVEDEEVEMAASKRKEQNPKTEILARSSVVDPDLHVVGPSGSVSQSYGSGTGTRSSSKNSRNLDSFYFMTSL
jgi:hypothetical protein